MLLLPEAAWSRLGHAMSVWKHISVNIPFMTISDQDGIGGLFGVSLWCHSLSASHGPPRNSIVRQGSCTESMPISGDGHRHMSTMPRRMHCQFGRTHYTMTG